ncbi:hypothetical protein MTR67_040389 [Solanum verrucosum]|uniref:Chromo domain-containing protein n=1 Tax=Solanum verrucosum TaxID=315347 RepID=A0AAF0UJG9_SOLVR|nr:hypothetical protein MTR67_040389 [Solanum verrucosum]
MKGVMRFDKKGKLSPRYIRPYHIVKRIGSVAYKLEQPQELAAVHPVFHISMLKKCMGDPSLIVQTENVEIKDNLSYEEIPVQILDRQVRKLRTKEVASVKVLWRNQFVEEATWEAEEDIKTRYPHLFESREDVNQVIHELYRVKTQVTRISIQCAVDLVEHSRVSGIKIGEGLQQIVTNWWVTSHRPKLRRIYQAIPAIVMWEICKKRNARRHGRDVYYEHALQQFHTNIFLLMKKLYPWIKAPNSWKGIVEMLRRYKTNYIIMLWSGISHQLDG